MRAGNGRTVFVKDIDVELSASGINKAIREIKKFIRELMRGVTELCEQLMEDGESIAKVEVATLGAVDTGALMASIGHGAFDRSTGTGIIYAGSYYAVFVEFGTGVIGAENPHPGIAAGDVGEFAVHAGQTDHVYVKYDTYNHGEHGWLYRKVGSKTKTWTMGIESRPFMYNTYMTLQEIAEHYGGETIAEFIT